MAKAKDDMPLEFLQCRDLQHSWDATDIFVTQPTPNELRRELTCTRCGGIKAQLLDLRTFEVLSTSYEMPIGYRVRGGLKKQEARKLHMQQSAAWSPAKRKPKAVKR